MSLCYGLWQVSESIRVVIGGHSAHVEVRIDMDTIQARASRCLLRPLLPVASLPSATPERHWDAEPIRFLLCAWL